MKISVIIPTHNRLNILKQCLQYLDAQTLDKDKFEIIIVDDGSTDGTDKIKDTFFESLDLNIKYFHQNQGGPAKARNKAIKEATNDLLVIIGDDILPKPDFLNEHLNIHCQHPDQNIAVIGKTSWDPSMQITEFMQYLENGIQFAFNELTNDNISFKHCYTSNISISKSFLIKPNLLFMEAFPYAAYEDIEWGYRLSKNGITFRYNENAKAYHHHPISLKDYKKRMFYAGKACAYLCKLHPEIGFTKKSASKKLYLLEKWFKASYMEFILENNFLSKFCNISKIKQEKWIKTILSYYEEKGFREENAKLSNK